MAVSGEEEGVAWRRMPEAAETESEGVKCRPSGVIYRKRKRRRAA